MTIARSAVKIQQKVASAAESVGRSAKSVKIIAVTKYSDIEVTREFVAAGLTNLAENRADKFLEKYQALQDCNITWHFIGNLQSRKVKDIINFVDIFHALDSLKLAREIEKRATHRIQCFLEVNVSGEESKHGFHEKELFAVVDEIKTLKNIEIIGLMTMAPIDASNNELVDIFEKTHQLQVRLASLKIPNISCKELSMGMSRDYEVAIMHGATMVRIGHEFLK